MKKDTTTIDFMKQVSALYRKTGSLQKTAEELGISYSKVRKILITINEYETEFSKEVNRKYMNGKSIIEIANEMKLISRTSRIISEITIPKLNETKRFITINKQIVITDMT